MLRSSRIVVCSSLIVVILCSSAALGRSVLKYSAILGIGETSYTGELTLIASSSHGDSRILELRNNSMRTVVIDSFRLTGGGSNGCSGSNIMVPNTTTRVICSIAANPLGYDGNTQMHAQGYASIQLAITWHKISQQSYGAPFPSPSPTYSSFGR